MGAGTALLSRLLGADHRVPAWVRWPITVASFGLALYWFATFRGPYRWLAEWQLTTFGGFSVGRTVTAVLLLNLASSWALLRVLDAMWPAAWVRAPDAADEGIFGPSDPPATRRRRLFIALVLGAAMLVTGGVLVLRGDAAPGAPTSVDIVDLENGEAPAASFVELRGKAMINQRITFADEAAIPHTVHHYVPVVSSWGGPTVRVFLDVPEDELAAMREQPSQDPIRGTLDPAGLPAAAAAQWRVRGFDIPQPHWILTRTSGTQGGSALPIALIVAGFLTIAAATATFLHRRRAA